MAENSNKLKLLKLYEILRKDTDIDRPLSRQELLKVLSDQGIPVSIRTIDRDIEALIEFGFEIISFKKDHERYYYVPEREFSIPELKILMDAVQAASFVTEKKTKEIIDKIASLGGTHRADLLKRNMVCFNTRKHTNEQVIFSIDSLEDAIVRKKKVAFHYFDLNEKGEREYRLKVNGEKKRYYVEPIALVFNEDNYYLMTYSSRHPDNIANYRVDRMEYVEVVEDSILSDEATAKIESVGKYTEQAFKMYDGETVSVVLEFEKCLIGPVFDKFGEDTKMMRGTGERYVATVDAQVSKTFLHDLEEKMLK